MAQTTIVVTGGAGHVGSHVVEMLAVDAANRVISLDNYFTGREENHVPGVDYRRGHTQDIDRLVPETPDLLLHLGEYARIAPSFDDVRQVFEMNISGTFAVVEFCRLRRVPKLVYAASSTRFAIEGDGRHQSPYAFTKATNVDLIIDYGRWYGLPYALCYFYNGFGPRERGEGKYGTLIAKFERLYLQCQPMTVVRPGTQRRAFTHVTDLARGMILAGEKGSGAYSFGQTETYSILEIAEAFGGPVEMIDGYAGRSEAFNDPNKAREELGRAPTVDVMDYISNFRKTHSR